MDIGKYLAEKLNLELSEEKTLVTIATDKARFLGFDIRARKPSNLQRKTKRGCYARNYNGHIVLEVPTELVQKKLLQLGTMEIKKVGDKEIWKLTHRRDLTNRKDIYILNQYNGEVQGFCNYYSVANNRSKLHKSRYIMEYSMYKTFACKYRTTKKKIIEKYRIDKDFGVRYTDWKGKERIRLFWKGSLARNDFPQEAKVDTATKKAIGQGIYSLLSMSFVKNTDFPYRTLM